jgi:hypothetical protein
VARFTETLSIPSNTRIARSTRAEQAAQVIPPMDNVCRSMLIPQKKQLNS